MRKRKTAGLKLKSKEKHVGFAKNLFKYWDEDQSGRLDLEEFTLPLVALGLATNKQFVAKVRIWARVIVVECAGYQA